MKWIGDIGLELYVATPRFQGGKQYEDSQMVLELVNGNGLAGRIDLTYLNRLNTKDVEYFNTIKDPDKQTRLPFLECVYGCMTGAVLGYSGLEEITNVLKNLHFL